MSPNAGGGEVAGGSPNNFQKVKLSYAAVGGGGGGQPCQNSELSKQKFIHVSLTSRWFLIKTVVIVSVVDSPLHGRTKLCFFERILKRQSHENKTF
jgi:hypothetical protein